MSEEPSWRLGVVLEQARKQQRVSRKEMARRSGLSDTLLQTLERGYELRRGTRFDARPKPETVIAAARAYGVDIAQALTLAGIEGVEVPTDEPDHAAYLALQGYVETIRRAWGDEAAAVALDRVYKSRDAAPNSSTVGDAG